ncbi:MAG: YkgJ family cysteine cluster protein [Rhodospirillaceae bacterium]|nr:YkgJ family cysteine cluster protein [Rhodospirillales bacterium]
MSSDSELIVSLAGQLGGILGKRLTPDGLCQATGSLLALAEGEITALLELPVNAEARPACAIDCHACCHCLVGATAPEVIILASRIALLPAETVTAIRQRTAVVAMSMAAMSLDQRMSSRTACPFLHERRCQVYALRPLACRGHTSINRAICDSWLETGEVVTVPTISETRRVVDLSHTALTKALRPFNVRMELLDFRIAIHLALSDGTLAEQWCNGGDPFAAAVV